MRIGAFLLPATKYYLQSVVSTHVHGNQLHNRCDKTTHAANMFAYISVHMYVCVYISIYIYIYIYMAEASFSAYFFGFLQGKKQHIFAILGQKGRREEAKRKTKIGRAFFGRQVHFFSSFKQNFD